MSPKTPYIRLHPSYGSSLPLRAPDGSSPLPEIHKDLFKMVDMAIAIEKERTKVLEAVNSRDATVGRLREACNSLRQKTTLLERLQKENKLPGAVNADLESLNQVENETVNSDVVNSDVVNSDVVNSDIVNSEVVKLKQEIDNLESTINGLRDEIKILKESSIHNSSSNCEDPQNKKEWVNTVDNFNSKSHLAAPANPYVYGQRISHPVLSRVSSLNSIASNTSHGSGTTIFHVDDDDLNFTIVRSTSSGEAEDVIQSRNKLLASLPLPEDTPGDALKPIMLPSHVALHEFLSNAPANLRHQLPHYRVLDELTTYWCPQREEHGYILTPAFKCTTHPRVSTAHQWNLADVFGSMTKPTDCFYNKDGTWYYAGVYRAFRLDDLTIKEWDALSQETTLFLSKETLAGRKNLSPQNVYEVTQLYGAGALKIACIGLQCVGFNREMYRSILTLVEKSNQTSKFKQNIVHGHGHGRGASKDIVDAMASLQIASRAENGA